ncbi:xanthine dehydrogenase family protein molybdopterin-binding subunit [Dysosmobacter sp.]|uniref:xanthine dehydrogenase family protein molybdopterin-binding subunit n=1 Tax=Dysosmobacter sp. TaxID=2591382 RepID=UPI002A84CB49|nr:molybdopterin cofactor-binding domain-containing protein [Dysosmobacter sp.]MDY3280974.1 molybdopterin cofactor-binding domain-containing protein [Dysosmobacter sp.]
METKTPFQTVNHPIPRLESMDKATGKALYTDDIRLPNTAYAAIVRSPYSRAKVLSIDISAAEKVPGYLGCLMPEEAPTLYFNCSGNPPSPLLMADETVFTREPKVLGDRIMCVAAETEEAARLAADAVHVEYEVLTPCLDIPDALRPDAVPVQPHISADNVIQHREVFQGDRKAGEEASDIIVEDHFYTPPMQHATIELTSCLCDFSDGKHLTVYSTSQTVFQERRIMAQILGLKETDVRFNKPIVGGGFGARQQLHAQHVAALMSRKLKRPVNLTYTREEDLYSVVRHGSDVDLRIGATKDGMLQLFDTTFRLNAGPFTTHSPTVVAAAARKLQYNVPNYFFHGISVFTNHITGGAFRGYGNSQLTFGREILMDRLATALNMDPVELRLKNQVQVGECFPCASIPVSSNGIEACAKRCREIQDEIDAKAPLIDNDEIRQAWGIAFSCHGSGPSSKEGLSGAVIMLNADATVHLLVGSADIGQGSETMECQIAAECLGIPLSDVQITAADTLTTPYNTGTFGSSQTFICGNAVTLACDDLKRKVLEQLKVIYSGCEVEEKDHRYYIRGTENLELSFREAAEKILFDFKGGVMIGSGSYKAAACPNPFSVCFVKAEYHKKLNAIRLLDIIQVVDVGTPINRMTVAGQLEGGIAQGVGYALYERMEINPRTKRTLSSDLLHYRIPQMDDMPQTYVDMVDSYDPYGPLGAKSVGELATVPVAPAIVNAVRHAAGTEISSLPLCDKFVILPSKRKEERR